MIKPVSHKSPDKKIPATTYIKQLQNKSILGTIITAPNLRGSLFCSIPVSANASANEEVQ